MWGQEFMAPLLLETLTYLNLLKKTICIDDLWSPIDNVLRKSYQANWKSDKKRSGTTYTVTVGTGTAASGDGEMSYFAGGCGAVPGAGWPLWPLMPLLAALFGLARRRRS